MKHIQPIVTDYRRTPLAPRLRKLERVAIWSAALLLLSVCIWLAGSAAAHLYNK